MEGFNQGWGLILPGCGETTTLPPGATLAARWRHELQPIRNQPVGLEFPPRFFMAGSIRDGTGRDCFDMFGEKKIEDGTGRQNNAKYSCLDEMGR